MKRMKRYYEKEGRQDEAQRYNVCPITFVLPQEYSMFVEEFKKYSGSTWIMKPIGKSQGAGIFLVNKLAQLQQWRPPTNWADKFSNKKADKDKDDDDDRGGQEGPEAYVVQKYIDGPLLIGGKKFDIRMYALVTCYTPMTVYMHRGGFCRFSMSRYTSDKNDMSNLAKHLTNVAVQKNSGKAAYKRTGAKWDVQRLKTYIECLAGLDVVNNLFCGIEAIVISTLLAVQKVMINDKHCFELYGFDILIDTAFKPWLLEVNASPSLTANTVDDYNMKFGMLDDCLSIIDIEKYLSGNEVQIGGFDLLYRDGYRYGPPAGSEVHSYLGCMNNRMPQLKRLAKTRAWELGRDCRRGDGVVEDQRPEAIASRAGRSCRPYPAPVPGSSTASSDIPRRPISRADTRMAMAPD
jgi:tubulin polyglutamylase TTLL9